MIVRSLELLTLASGSSLVLLAQVPGVPDNFERWPAAAIMGLVTLAALAVVCLVIRSVAKAMTDSAKSLAEMAEVQRESNRLAAEQAKKAGETNMLLTAWTTELRVRPCLAEVDPETDATEEARRKGLRKTQRIS